MAINFTATSYVIRTTGQIYSTTQGTLAFWLKPIGWASGDSTAHSIISAGTTSIDVQFQRFSDNQFYTGCGNPARMIFADTGLAANGRWDHWVIVWSSVEQRTFWNGASKKTSAGSGAFTPGPGLVLGSMNNNFGISATAAMADVGIWNQVLSQVEINSLVFGGARPFQVRPQALTACYLFDWYTHPAWDLSIYHRMLLPGSGSSAGGFTPGPPLISAAPVFPGVPMPQAFQMFTFTPPTFVLMPQIVM